MNEDLIREKGCTLFETGKYNSRKESRRAAIEKLQLEELSLKRANENKPSAAPPADNSPPDIEDDNSGN